MPQPVRTEVGGAVDDAGARGARSGVPPADRSGSRGRPRRPPRPPPGWPGRLGRRPRSSGRGRPGRRTAPCAACSPCRAPVRSGGPGPDRRDRARTARRPGCRWRTTARGSRRRGRRPVPHRRRRPAAPRSASLSRPHSPESGAATERASGTAARPPGRAPAGPTAGPSDRTPERPRCVAATSPEPGHGSADWPARSAVIGRSTPTGPERRAGAGGRTGRAGRPGTPGRCAPTDHGPGRGDRRSRPASAAARQAGPPPSWWSPPDHSAVPAAQRVISKTACPPPPRCATSSSAATPSQKATPLGVSSLLNERSATRVRLEQVSTMELASPTWLVRHPQPAGPAGDLGGEPRSAQQPALGP